MQAFFEPTMFRFPVARTDFRGLAGLESFQSKRLQFVLRLLFRADETLKVGLDGKALRFGAGSQPAFKFGMNRNAHDRSAPPQLTQIVTRPNAVVILAGAGGN